MWFLSACMSVYHMHVWCLQRPEEGVEPGTGAVTDGCEPSLGCWGLNLDSLKEQLILVTTTEPFFSVLPSRFLNG